MILLPEIKTAKLSTYGNFAKCHQVHFCVSRVGLGMRLVLWHVSITLFGSSGISNAIKLPAILPVNYLS